jgi:hypothetical protein
MVSLGKPLCAASPSFQIMELMGYKTEFVISMFFTKETDVVTFFKPSVKEVDS